VSGTDCANTTISVPDTFGFPCPEAAEARRETQTTWELSCVCQPPLAAIAGALVLLVLYRLVAAYASVRQENAEKQEEEEVV
jgi:hypothetical protein